MKTFKAILLTMLGFGIVGAALIIGLLTALFI